MASKIHDFIVSVIAGVMRKNGFKIIYLHGRYQDIDIKRFKIPPKIINHKPDVIGENNEKDFCIGEAKTKNDIFMKRTLNQIRDFHHIVTLNKKNWLIIGVPLKAKIDLEVLLSKIGILEDEQIKKIYVPERIFPNGKV